MDRQQVFAWARNAYGTEPDYPWNDSNAVLRHPGGKWYGVILRIPASRLGRKDEGSLDVLNVKCDPILAGSLRCKPGYYPAYHMNKEKWISLALDGSVPEQEITELLALSHGLTAPKRRRAPASSEQAEKRKEKSE